MVPYYVYNITAPHRRGLAVGSGPVTLSVKSRVWAINIQRMSQTGRLPANTVDCRLALYLANEILFQCRAERTSTSPRSASFLNTELVVLRRNRTTTVVLPVGRHLRLPHRSSQRPPPLRHLNPSRHPATPRATRPC